MLHAIKDLLRLVALPVANPPFRIGYFQRNTVTNVCVSADHQLLLFWQLAQMHTAFPVPIVSSRTLLRMHYWGTLHTHATTH